jgi:hypothetical protein
MRRLSGILVGDAEEVGDGDVLVDLLPAYLGSLVEQLEGGERRQHDLARNYRTAGTLAVPSTDVARRYWLGWRRSSALYGDDGR